MSVKLKQDISIGHNLKELRIKNGFSQEALASHLQLKGHSISREIISQMERGNYNIRISVLVSLSQIYDVSFNEFFKNLGIEDFD